MIPLDGRRGLAANDVTVAVRCSDGTLWFGTGCGMGCYRPGEGAVAVEFAHDQLQTGVIHGLLADSLDNVWAATNAGIVRYNPAAHRSVAYGASYGLEVVEFSDGAYFTTAVPGSCCSAASTVWSWSRAASRCTGGICPRCGFGM